MRVGTYLGEGLAAMTEQRGENSLAKVSSRLCTVSTRGRLPKPETGQVKGMGEKWGKGGNIEKRTLPYTILQNYQQSGGCKALRHTVVEEISGGRWSQRRKEELRKPNQSVPETSSLTSR